MNENLQRDGQPRGVDKVPTGIRGLDDITYGGFPAGRPTLVSGGPGCGKTVLGMEFLVKGARDYNQPGLFLSFEESEEHLRENFLAMGFPLEELIENEMVKISQVLPDDLQITQSGKFSLDGLLIQIQHAIQELGIQRIVLDTVGKVFAVLEDNPALRSEIARLMRWLRDQDLHAVVTSEIGENRLSRYGLTEYVSDCVILLDNRVDDQISKRRLRIIKYRGSEHVKDEVPFLISEKGIAVFPLMAATLDHQVTRERISTGGESLDEMFDGLGYYRGSTVMVTGKAGTGKSSLAASFAEAACARGERALYIAFEESPAQIVRNMTSVGIDLEGYLEQGNLEIDAFRPSFRGLEEHLITIGRRVEKFQPNCVVMDPITGFLAVGSHGEVRSMLTRVLDMLKSRGITLMLTALITGSGRPDETEAQVSSLIDTWIGLDYLIEGHTRKRLLYIIKSRGMNHSNEKKELVISSDGLKIQSIRRA